MTCRRFFVLSAMTLITGLLVEQAAHAQGGPRYEVTVTNITRDQRFTPILVASHREGVHLFALGDPASAALETLAEEGNTGPLTTLLLGMSDVADVQSSPAPPPADNLIAPGESITVSVEAKAGFNHVSVAAMLIPTNDAFFALNGMPGPRGNETVTFFAPAYDAGSEVNNEMCASIPGPGFPECVTGGNPDGNGGGAMTVGGEEGFVHIHGGIHGIGDLSAAHRDWRNPVAKIMIRRVR